MKNKRIITAFLAVLLLAGTMIPFLTVSAVNRMTVYETSFETEQERSGWSFIDGDRDKKNWIVEKSTASGYESKDGEWLMYSSSEDVTGLDNYAISPPIELPDIGDSGKFPNLRLSWYVGANSQYLMSEEYSVYVYDASSGAKLSSSNIDSFVTSTTAIKNEVMIEGGYNNYKYRTVDLEEYAGKTVQIVFRHHNCDQRVLKIDLIKIEKYFSQKVDIFTETFENEDFDTKWMKYDKDNDGFSWDVSTIGANSGSCSAGSMSYFIKDLKSDNFLISPVINIGEFVNLQATWFAGGIDSDFFNEHYRVYTYFGNETEASKIAEECVASTNCASAEFTLEAYKFREYNLDLDPMTGAHESFRLVFRHYDCTDSFRRLLLDDISVTGVEKNQTITSANLVITAPNFEAMASEDGQTPGEAKLSLITGWGNKVKDSVYSVEYKWHKDGDTAEITSFDFGESYSVDITAKINESDSSEYLFADTFQVENAQELNISDTEVSFTVNFDAVNKKKIDTVNAKLDYSLGKSIVAPTVSNVNCVVSGGTWMASANNTNYSALSETETVFLPNKYYKFSCNVTPKKGYVFAENLNSDDNIVFENGELTIVYSPLTAMKINSISVSGITAPAIEETATVDGIAVNSDKENLLSVDQSAVKWIEVGNETKIISKFDAKKSYTLIIPLNVNELYETNESTEISLQTGIDALEVKLENNVIKITFSALEPIEIETIAVDITGPRAGESPNNIPIFSKIYPEKEQVKFFGEWQVKNGDSEYVTMAQGDSFELSEEIDYRYVLTVEPNSQKYSVADAEVYISGDKVIRDETTGKYIKEFGKADYCKVIFNTEGGTTNDEKIGEITVFTHKGAGITAPGGLQKDGHTFEGWSETQGATKPDTIPDVIESDLVYYAIFKAKSYTITFVNTGNSTVNAITQDYNSAVTLPTAPTKTGYTFAGWQRANETILNAGDTFAMPLGGETVTATWTINEYEATFDAAGGSFKNGHTTATVKANYGEAIEAPEAPAKTGYTFKGWTPKVGTMPADETTFSAIWEANSYNAIFNANGGSWLDGETMKVVPTRFNEKIQKPTAPQKPGYVFDGWNVEPNTMDDVNGKTFMAQYILSGEAKPEISGYVTERTEKYKTTIKFYADYGVLPNGASVSWFINGRYKGSGESCTVKNATENFTAQIKLIDDNGNILHESKTETVKIKAGFFDKLVAFFQGLFGTLPNIVQK